MKKQNVVQRIYPQTARTLHAHLKRRGCAVGRLEPRLAEFALTVWVATSRNPASIPPSPNPWKTRLDTIDAVVTAAVGWLREHLDQIELRRHVLVSGSQTDRDGSVKWTAARTQALKGEQWSALLQAAGPAVMLELLTLYAVFEGGARGSFVQVAGPRASEEPAFSTRAATRPTLDCVRFLYGRPRESRGAPQAGLPRSHLLETVARKSHGDRRLVGHVLARAVFGLDAGQRVPRGLAAAARLLGELHAAHKRLEYTAGFDKLTGRWKPKGRPNVTWQNLVVPQKAACAFVDWALDRVVPRTLIGGDCNWRIIRARVRDYVALQRLETLSVELLVSGLSVKECGWLGAETSLAQRHARLAQVATWLFDEYVRALLRSSFYATDTGTFRNRIVMFRHDAWRVLTAPHAQALMGGLLREIPASDHELEASLGSASLRWAPKATGMRPIVNLGRPAPGQEWSINTHLRPLFEALRFERTRSDELLLLGSAVRGHDDVFRKLSQFKKELLERHGGRLPRLHAVAVDIQRAFDTVEHPKVLETARALLRSHRYVDRRANVTFDKGDGELGRLFRRRGSSWPAETSFTKERPNSIVETDYGGRLSTRQRLATILDTHVRQSMVRVGNTVHVQQRGLSQGSIVAPLLFLYTYGELEKTHLAIFASSPTCALLRMVDDFILISTSQLECLQFLDVMRGGFSAFGCALNDAKTRATFPGPHKTVGAWMPWAGLLVHVPTLSVHADYGQRLSTAGLRDGLRISATLPPALLVRRRLVGAALRVVHPLFLNVQRLNSPRVARINWYMALYAAACRARVLADALERGGRPPAPGAVASAAATAVAVALARARRQRLVGRGEISAAEVEW